MNKNNKPWYIGMVSPVTVGIICLVVTVIVFKLWY